MDIARKVKDYLEETCQVSDLKEDDNLFDLGVVDSLFALQLIVFIEKEFNIKVKNKDITEKNFSSVKHIVDTVNRLNK